MAVRFDSGRICLDLAAQPLDRTEALDQFLHAAGLVPVTTTLRALDAHWVAHFRELRDCVGALVNAQLDGECADRALERLNELAAASAPPAPRAVRTETGGLVRALSDEPDCRALLAAVARDAVDLLTDPAARALLRRCEGDNCRRCYLDTSRGRRRRWCSSETCGNRERVARHRAARRAHVAV
ncbi:CGNR zinc finger domain-containing protein [Streptomyces vilmorinianum]|uniref:CGNR zinc finger domain-containing protein n=1 Tax=Streptomyces vilmorinianum TaxID=3051092 RepID=UPI0010FBAAB7|nr:ABATE domain-containing protein [Streptomyces vilmorinianum]